MPVRRTLKGFCVTGGRLKGAHATQGGEGGFAAQPVGVVAGGLAAVAPARYRKAIGNRARGRIQGR